MSDLTVTLIQSDLHWENPGANLAMFEEKIWQITDPTDIIVLPEMFTTGFTMNAATFAEPMNLTTFKWMKQLAAQTGAVLVGSFVVKEGDQYYNRLLWMPPDGQYQVYDKRHLFRMAGEHLTYSAGTRRIIPEVKGWRICPLVCYDLRFPVWSRNQRITPAETDTPGGPMQYDCLLYIANWPQPRNSAWNILLQARAIENLSYVVGVNRIKTDGKGIAYSGDSAVISPKGERLFYAGDQEIIQTVTLSKEDLLSLREKFPAYLDGDAFKITS
jgi:omega-amidase